MLQVDPSLFSNVVITVQRTASLPGGTVSGLPGGVTLGGLQGVQSMGSDVAEAQKEFELGRRGSALQRVRQLSTQFESSASRWNGSVNQLINSTRTGSQKLGLNKINEVKACQVKMQQLIGPASKAFRDLALALEQAVSAEGREEDGEAVDGKRSRPIHGDDPHRETPPDEWLGSFAVKYVADQPFRIVKARTGKVSIQPRFEIGKLVLMTGLDPPRVVRIREVESKVLRFFDPLESEEVALEGKEILQHVKAGIWTLTTRP